MKALTAAQTKVLDWIKAYVREKGYAPTRSEIAEGMGFASGNAAEEHLQALSRKGAIRITPKVARSIVVVDQGADGAGVAGSAPRTGRAPWPFPGDRT